MLDNGEANRFIVHGASLSGTEVNRSCDVALESKRGPVYRLVIRLPPWRNVSSYRVRRFY